MGKRSAPIVREWVTGRDIHGRLDVAIAEWWLELQDVSKTSAAKSEKLA
jgi:N-acylneuraminate cytidylyltransferase